MQVAMGQECRVGSKVANAPGSAPRIADFRALLGELAWHRLPVTVRDRFGLHARVAPIVYRGFMRVQATWLGSLFAQLCRVVGTPVVPGVGDRVPMEVRVYDCADCSGTVWERRYHFAGRAMCIVRSIKQLDTDGALLEKLAAGLHMRLHVCEIAGALHFISAGYFMSIGSMRFELPRWLPPGTTHVVHEDRGGGRFRFLMRTTHPWFGEMFVQDGEFE